VSLKNTYPVQHKQDVSECHGPAEFMVYPVLEPLPLYLVEARYTENKSKPPHNLLDPLEKERQRKDMVARGFLTSVIRVLTAIRVS
jgi:hypothetical protein